MRDIAALAAPLHSPALHIVSQDEPSLSHFGGSPRLASGYQWPSRDGARLDFLARLSLVEIQRALPIPWLPASGALLFFYDTDKQPWGFDPKDFGSFAVLHVPDQPSPINDEVEVPNGTPPQLPHVHVGFHQVDTLPSWEREPVQALNLTDEEADEYFRLADVPFRGKPKHQLAGYPAAVQGDTMELECQLVSSGLYCGDLSGYQDPRAPGLEAGAADWCLLLQLDSDDDLGVMWGDSGAVYYWVKRDAARVGAFHNSWLVLQCG